MEMVEPTPDVTAALMRAILGSGTPHPLCRPENFEQVPLIVMPFHRNDRSGSSIYPAVWNLMLAARGQGVGTTLTTILGFFEAEAVFELLGVPSDKGWVNAAAITCGYPLGRWGVANRAPADAVTYANRWGDSPSWSIPEPLWSPEG